MLTRINILIAWNNSAQSARAVHSRIAEIIMGGMTKSLLANQELPIFFAH